MDKRLKSEIAQCLLGDLKRGYHFIHKPVELYQSYRQSWLPA